MVFGGTVKSGAASLAWPAIPPGKRSVRLGGSPEFRVLVLAPIANDARLTAEFFAKNGVAAHVCDGGISELCEQIEEGCGAIFVAEEALGREAISRLAEALSGQPSWSDVPITVITGTGRDLSHTRFERLKALDPCGNVTILERPFRPDTLLKNAEVSLRARQRQYQVRDLLEEGRKREERLRASEERFRRMSDSAPVLIWMAGLDRRCVWFNKAWLDFIGRSMDEEIGSGWTDHIHPEDSDRCLQTYQSSFDARTEFQIEYRIRRHDGAWRWLLDHGVPLYGVDNELTGYIGSCIDITERKETFAELEKLVSERTQTLQQTIGDLEAFSYTVSHDLRAPLRAVQSYAQILADEYREALDEAGLDYLGRIVKAGRRLDGLIQDVLTYSRVSRRDYPMHPVELGPLVNDIVRQYPEFRRSKVDVDVREPLLAVMGSEPLLTQCLSNLLGNAVKFVPQGERAKIVLRCEENGDRIRLWVEDNGIGIPLESQDRIFGMFERLDQKAYEGTGVGLAIVRKAVERMSGKIGLLSEPGGGSRFWIDLNKPGAERTEDASA